METKQSTSIKGIWSEGDTVSMPSTILLADDGAMRIGATRIGYAYIFERRNSNPLSDSDLLFDYDLAGNQISREVETRD